MSKHRSHGKRRKEELEEELSDESVESSELDSEEEEDAVEHHRKHHKRHREANDVRNLFIDEAEAVDEDEEEEEDADGYDAELLGPEEDEALQSAALTSARDLEARNRMKEFAEQDEESLERYFKQRYDAQESSSHRFGEGAAMTANIVQQQNVPGIKDPNLWLVKCQMGEEKATVLALMRKFFALQTKKPLQIKSAFAKEGLKGYIYIEAFKQTHVKQAIEGISALARAAYEQRLVPISEMIDVMRVVKETASLKPKQWVRLKSGLYKDDLAQVESVEDAQNVVWLRLLPRIDYERKRGRFGKPVEAASGDPSEPQRKQRFKRPPAAPFDPTKVADRITSQSGGFTVFEGNQYDSAGFLRKDFRLNLVTADGVRPTLAELERFNQLPDGVAASRSLAAAAAAAASSVSGGGGAGEAVVGHSLMPGDVVEVCEGELRNLRGTVISVEAGGANRVIVQPSHHDLKEPIEFAPVELRKYFAQGDHVRVLRGRYEGETGLVLAYDSLGGGGGGGAGGGGSCGVCTILPDSGMSEIRVAPRDLRLWNDRGVGSGSVAASSGCGSGGATDGVERAKLMDFVQLDAQNYGVVVHVDRENVRVLTCLGKVASVAANTALRVVKFGGPRGGISPQALDREGNVIQVKDSVRLLEKPYAGLVGEIRYIFRSWVFVYSRTHAENAGVLVAKSRQLAKVGATGVGGIGGEGAESQQSRPPVIQRVNGPGGFRRPGGGSGGGGKDSLFADRALIGKTARIVAGTLKGLTGIICDVSAHDVYVELHSQFKKVHVLRQNVALLDAAGNIVESKLVGAAVTPSTPRSMHSGAATPLREPRTPMVGSMTPYVSSMTPRADATPLPYAFNANMATPAHYAASSSSVYGESELAGGGGSGSDSMLDGRGGSDPFGGQTSSSGVAMGGGGRTPAYQTPAWHTPDPHRGGLGSVSATPRAEHVGDDDEDDEEED